MHEIDLPAELARLSDQYSKIFVIVSPPRCSSTPFARVFWEQPSIRYYCHEPFEVTYFWGQGLRDVADKIEHPLDLRDIAVYDDEVSEDGNDDGLVIKEMPYQVGRHFPLLAALATKPIVFLMRDPRLNISSRMKKKQEVGDDPIFPTVETGWELLASQIEWCRNRDVPHVLVDSTDFRNHPEAVFEQVFDRLGLPFSPEMLSWRACEDVDLDNLEGDHSHLYRRVLRSTGIEPATRQPPPVETFPETRGWRRHVVECLRIYEELSRAPERISPAVATAGR